jgi:L-asparaginase
MLHATWFVVNDSSTIVRYLKDLIRPHFEISQEILTLRDSRGITDGIRAEMVRSIENCSYDFILITHGTYTMAVTAEYLAKELKISDKRVVLTGSMLPLQGFAPTDATFNVGFAIGALFLAQPGVYVAMNGALFPAGSVVKDVSAGRFEAV